MPNGTSGSSSSGSTSGGGGSGGEAAGGSSSGSGGAQAGSASGGAPSAGTGGVNAGGSAGMSGGMSGSDAGGTGGKAGSAGSAGSAGAGGGGAGGSAGSGGQGGSGGSGGTPVNACMNSKADGDETDVDCGGKVCTARCANGKDCAVVTDCIQTPTGNVCDEDACRANGCNADNCAYALTRSIDGATAARGQAFVSWDSDSLDVEIQMLDATDYNDSEANWEDDSVEIYLDLNNAGTASYEVENDFQITVPRAAVGLSGTSNYTQGAVVVSRTSNASGYSLTISIPWAALNGAASPVGSTIGFDIGVNDDSDGGPRNSQLMLYGNGNNYQNTSAFGDLVLTP